MAQDLAALEAFSEVGLTVSCPVCSAFCFLLSAFCLLYLRQAWMDEDGEARPARVGAHPQEVPVSEQQIRVRRDEQPRRA